MTLTSIKMIFSAICAAAATCALALEPGDADVLAARDAAQRGQWKLVEGYRARLAGHPLEAYPSYWILAGSVDRADPRDVRAFLDHYPGTPLAETLRREWLRALGAAGSWDAFAAEYPKLLGDDVEITCYWFQGRRAHGDLEVAGEAHALFVSGRETASACDPVFAALVADKSISEAEVWTRLRVLLAAANVKEAKRTAALLPARGVLNEKALDRAAKDPARFLAHDKPRTRGDVEIALFAVEKLAAKKPDDAAERLAALASRLDAAGLRFAWGQLAWQAAMAHDPRALEWYAAADGTSLTDSQVAWKARAAMRAGDWKQVLAAIQALPPEVARDRTWRYWRARALRSLGEKQAAEGLLKTLVEQQDFYGVLAAEELGATREPDWNGWHPAAEDLERVRSVDGIRRALALYRIGLDNEATREWLWAIRGFDDRQLLSAAEVARQAGVLDRAINTADKTLQVHDLAQRFPTPHREALESAAKQWDLDAALVYAIIRQESRFVAEARSRMGATGLMQLMPSTARWIARQIPVQPFRTQMLVHPELNVQMGSYYFRRVLTALGEPLLATAAYNAGPGRANRWRDDAPLEGAIYAETIPFNETREYVKKVFTNAWFYRHRLTGKLASLRELLGTVPGRGAAETAVVANIP